MGPAQDARQTHGSGMALASLTLDRGALILMASPSQDTLARWEAGINGFSHKLCAGSLDSLKDDIVKAKPQVLLLDYDFPGLEDSAVIASLAKLNPETRIIVLGFELSDQTEWELFKAGVRGCCQKNINSSLLEKVITAVQQGELWMRRTVTGRLLAELGAIALEKNQLKQATQALLSNLTQRESEIATLVGNGESNKQIALRLDITERTVKAHLTEIFRKLNVADRLKLALLVTGSFPQQE